MNIHIDSIIQLLHECGSGSLATHSQQAVGYPFPTILPFALDESHCPLFLISGLAEHTRNLVADPRAGFLVHGLNGPNLLNAERVSLMGDMQRVEASPELTARYLRYHPDAEQYLALGDFSFFKLVPQHARYIAGFGRMGWTDPDEWAACPSLPLADEAGLIVQLNPPPVRGMRLLGLDCYGFDLEKNGQRERQRFPDSPVAAEQLAELVPRYLAAM